EYTYQQKTGKYQEFRNICFVDTLDNTAALNYRGKQSLMFGISSENAARIKKQNERTISVIIGNPPYNANQANFNDFNRNRDYKEIDRRIKDTYVKNSTAQKTKVYDMYARFIRWASDRIDKDGIIAFVSNNSFIDSHTYDGFRKVVAEEFNEAHIINLKGNARTTGERRRRESGNIFSDQIRVGVAVYFLVKNSKKKGFKVYYNEIKDYASAEDKKTYLRENKFEDLAFERITPNEKHHWIDIADNDFESLLPLFDKRVKLGKSENAVFKLYSLGVSTNRDEWITDYSSDVLLKKMRLFITEYDKAQTPEESPLIKWSNTLSSRFLQKQKEPFDKKRVKPILYRPYFKQFLYYSDLFIDRPASAPELFLRENKTILCRYGERLDFYALATNYIPSLNFFSLEGAQAVSLYRYDKRGARHDNITIWGLMQFRQHYSNNKITREDIFHYTYAVLHHPVYRQKYALNLKREFPRLPFYEDFRQWAAWGKELMELHINYETAKPYRLKRVDAGSNSAPRPKLKADKTAGTIELDSETILQGVPASAWEYKLGNRSALEWILDQYKEKKPSDATIAEKFNAYRFADYKETVIDLLKRVCTVSVRTVEITNQMPKED
ncbi:MAG TPA: type ISP restriction/modification enzyme, partial [Pyrinomonadaceae bacterium]